ncbi:MAG TPA: hypothetical protein VFU88_08645, partial [Ktedonobacterales bacterium]|nr:hypothetical protein [Ktedonobacterales bacterium]
MVAIKHHAPALSEAEVRRIAAELYGLRIASQRALPGEHDQNVYLAADDGRQYVLKLSHADEQRDVLELQ